jgi:hypothetical protein
MTKDRLPVALLILQWALGLVVVAESAHFAVSPGAVLAFARTGLPHLIRPALAWAEIAAAILFLVPPTTAAGGRLLIVVFAAAIVIHVLHGWFDVGALVIYAAATWSVVAWKASHVTQQ